jgi:AcrR family transcriptional regulator
MLDRMSATGSRALPVQQRAWETREKILEAAVRCLAEDGYAATTTSLIQERAQVSRGSLLHQFPARDDLLIAAVQHLCDQRLADIQLVSAGEHQGVDAAIDELWGTFHGPLFRAATQLWVAAQHKPDLAAALVPREHELGRRIKSGLADLFGKRYAGHPAFGEVISLLVSSMRGVALTYAFEPRDHTRDPNLVLWRRLAREMLETPAPNRRGPA